MDTTTGSQTTRNPAARAGLRPARDIASALSGAAFLVLVSAQAAHAIPVPGVMARAIINPSFSCSIPGCAPVDNIVEGSTGPRHAEGFAIGGFSGAGSATADVDFGAMHLFSHFINSGNATGFGENRDLLTFVLPGVATGTLIQVSFDLLVEGAGIQGVNGAQGRWGLQADLGGGAFDINEFATNDDLNGYLGAPFGLYGATVTLQAGFAAPLDIELGATSASSSGGEAVADLTDSLFWGGITSVKVGGLEHDFTVTSASGTDWSHSFVPAAGGVPEPAAWTMMLVGFAGLGTALRARRRTAAA